ncbi:MAG: (Fe-S)-binding protein [Chloroflexi bacterium]|nr:(Fe-S)-binding protein [Chloroflexota bacterium]
MLYELLEEHKPTIWNCQVCSVCQRGPWNPYPPKGPTSDRLCPEYEKFRTLTHSALGRIQAAKWMLEGKYEPSDDFVKVVYDCLLCGACSTVGCVVDKEHVPMFRDLRTDLAKVGKGPIEPFVKTATQIEKEGNRFGRPKTERAKWAEGMNISQKADLVYFAGCVASYRAPQLAQATAKLLTHSGTEFVILGENEICCGNPLASSGQMDAFESTVKSNLEAFKEAGARQVITSCACCYNVLKFDYPQLAGNLDFEVVHITELLAKLVNEGKLKPAKPLNEKVTYHDPCHLARLGSRVIKEPRQVIASIPGIDLVEMEGNGKDTQCCGRYPVELPELSMLTGTNRIKDAETIGADTIVTACSFCDWNLNRAAKSVQSEIKVVDITQLMCQALGL